MHRCCAPSTLVLADTFSRAPYENLAESIRFVHACHKRIAPEVATELAEHAGDEALSPRELEVLTLVSSGNANKMIAAELCITEETVKGHVSFRAVCRAPVYCCCAPSQLRR